MVVLPVYLLVRHHGLIDHRTLGRWRALVETPSIAWRSRPGLPLLHRQAKADRTAVNDNDQPDGIALRLNIPQCRGMAWHGCLVCPEALSHRGLGRTLKVINKVADNTGALSDIHPSKNVD